MATDVLTADDPVLVEKLPDRFEVVNGEIVEVPSMGAYANEVANLLKQAVDRHLLTNDVGRCRIEFLFHTPVPEDETLNRRPDVAFVTYERWGRDRPIPLSGNALDVVPDLAVEVVSPSENAEEVLRKARQYLRAGVRVVWHVFPQNRELHAYDGTRMVKTFVGDDDLEGEPLLPGFKVKLTELFPPVDRH